MSGASSLQSADFKRVLASRPCARSAHFALHHQPPAAPPIRRRPLAGSAADAFVRAPAGVSTRPLEAELSTGTLQAAGGLVDDCTDRASPTAVQANQPDPAGQGHDRAVIEPAASAARLGLVVPKRLARRAVTRNLVKRQARVAFGQRQLVLPAGDWVLRLRAPIDPQRFPSAASAALRALLREELAVLFAQPMGLPGRGSSARRP